MKTIVLVALLAAAGCSKKGSDCGAAVTKGMDNFAASVKTDATNPQMQETRLNVISKLRGPLTQRCNEDKWPAEVVACFRAVAGWKDMQACQAKLSEAQRSKLLTELRQVMMGAMGAMGSRMPSGMAGHPPMLAGSGGPGSAAAPAGSAAPPAGGSAAPAAAGSAAPGGAAVPAPGGAAAPAPGGAAAPGAGAK